MNHSILTCNPNAAAVLEAFSRGGLSAHAFLVEGVRGSGRRSFARMLAAAAQCTAGEAGGSEADSAAQRPCGVCRDCVKIEKNIHPDLLRFAGEGRARSFHIDTVREIRQRAHIRPNEGRYTILLLEEVQTMSVQAQNALLKVLEEPPATALFLLTCDNRASLLETILSRVTPVALRPPEVEQCARILAERKPELGEQALLAAARSARGSVGEALRLLEGEGEDTQAGAAGDAQALLELLLAHRETEALALLGRYERDRGKLAELLAQAGRLAGEMALEDPAHAGANISRLQLMRILAIIDKGTRALASNANGLLLCTWLCAGVRGVLEVR